MLAWSLDISNGKSELLNPIPTWLGHVTLIYGLIPPMAGWNRVKATHVMNERSSNCVLSNYLNRPQCITASVTSAVWWRLPLLCHHVALSRTVRTRTRGWSPPTDSGRSVNPTRALGADYAHHITTCPPVFSDLPTAPLASAIWHAWPKNLPITMIYTYRIASAWRAIFL